MISPVKSKNLFHLCKRKSIDAYELNKYLQACPETNRNIGALPYDWLKFFPLNERSAVTRQVQDVFSSFSQNTACVPGLGRNTGWAIVKPERFAKEYDRLVQTLKKILKRDDIKIKYAGSGALKNCHRLDIGEYSYAFSTFRDQSVTRSGFGFYYKSEHGRGYEPQIVFTAYNNASQCRWGKPFMAKVLNEKDEGGYILSKFVDKQKKSKFGIFQKQCDYFINKDESDDVINNINTDIGGCVVNKFFVKDSVVRHMQKYFAKMLDHNSSLCCNFHTQKIQKYLLEQKQKGVDILSKGYVDTLPQAFNEPDRRCAVKLIRTLKKVRAMKERLMSQKTGDITAQNRFEEVKSILERDVKQIYTFDKYSVMADDFIGRLNNYPALVADELGLSNFPVMDGWVTMFHEYGNCMNFSCVKNRFTRADILKFIDTHYQDLRVDSRLIDKFRQSFGIEKELDVMENKYIML